MERCRVRNIFLTSFLNFGRKKFTVQEFPQSVTVQCVFLGVGWGGVGRGGGGWVY